MKPAVLAVFGILWLSTASSAQELLVAVAANFAAPAEEIVAAFEGETNISTDLSLGATGLLYAQIIQGAPYDVFLAADQARPQATIAAGFANPDTRVTYALGRLALYSRSLAPEPDIFSDVQISRVAIANPATAPFGAAALEVLSRLGVSAPFGFTILRGANVGQAFQFAATGNAELGFVSLSHAVTAEAGQHWLVPADMHSPIAQDAVVLSQSRFPEEARAFLMYLRSPAAWTIIEKYGYGLPLNG